MEQCKHDEFEEGELSDSDDGYTPLQRPGSTSNHIHNPSKFVNSSGAIKMDEVVEDTASDGTVVSSSSSSDSDVCSKLKKIPSVERKRKQKRPVLKPNHKTDMTRRFKKYDIWSKDLQEETLTEDMRGIGVANNRHNDRSVESYDYKIKYRLNDQRSQKRRYSSINDDHSDDDDRYKTKRSRLGSVKSRLGPRRRRSSDVSPDCSPRCILDLEESIEDKSPQEIGEDIAKKLSEQNAELIIKVVEVLGVKPTISLFKETQTIERDGGLLILNGRRRRTPGGVFLFLLKNSTDITPEQKELIFHQEQRFFTRAFKERQAQSRNRKVEELKKRLSAKEKNLNLLTTGNDNYLGSDLKIEHTSTLSNPPPSPAGQEHSPDYKIHAINHVSETNPDKVSTPKVDAPANGCDGIDDDFLDIHCEDMDFF